jgi:hypothetical protein
MRKLRGAQKEFPLEKLAELAFGAEVDVAERTAGSAEMSWMAGVWEQPKALARVLVNCGLLQLKEHQKADAEQHDFVEESQITERSWLAVHPMIAPGLRMLGSY